MTIYTGDILIQQVDDNFDIKFINGQPEMTDGLETMVLMAVFGEDWWGNDIVQSDSQKMKSRFPSIIRRGFVDDTTLNNGTKSIEKSLEFLLTENIAKSVIVTGEIYSVYALAWEIEIEAIRNRDLKYFINWEKGELTSQFVSAENGE